MLLSEDPAAVNNFNGLACTAPSPLIAPRHHLIFHFHFVPIPPFNHRSSSNPKEPDLHLASAWAQLSHNRNADNVKSTVRDSPVISTFRPTISFCIYFPSSLFYNSATAISQSEGPSFEMLDTWDPTYWETVGFPQGIQPRVLPQFSPQTIYFALGF